MLPVAHGGRVFFPCSPCFGGLAGEGVVVGAAFRGRRGRLFAVEKGAPGGDGQQEEAHGVGGGGVGAEGVKTGGRGVG